MKYTNKSSSFLPVSFIISVKGLPVIFCLKKTATDTQGTKNRFMASVL